MTIHPGGPKCCRRTVEITVPSDPDSPVEVKGDENTQMSDKDAEAAFKDAQDNPDSWKMSGPDDQGNVTLSRDAEFCGSELKGFYRNDPEPPPPWGNGDPYDTRPGGYYS